MFVSHIALDRRLKSILLAKTTISGQFQGVESVFVNSLKMKRIQTAGLRMVTTALSAHGTFLRVTRYQCC